ncbi:MAG: HD domain-containing protein [Candidatus Helarchaeota archaeon]
MALIYLTRKKALAILKKEGLSKNIIEHSIKVSKKAVKLAKKIRVKVPDVDVDLVEIGALLHDLGRSRRHDWEHGIEGAKIIRTLDVQNKEKLARIAETHLLGGLSPEDCREVGIPEGNYVPETLEEKIVSHADKLTKGSHYVSLEERFEIWFEKYGQTRILEEAFRRAKKTEEEIQKLLI